jgi:hypothetical protein
MPFEITFNAIFIINRCLNSFQKDLNNIFISQKSNCNFSFLGSRSLNLEIALSALRQLVLKDQYTV